MLNPPSEFLEVQGSAMSSRAGDAGALMDSGGCAPVAAVVVVPVFNHEAAVSDVLRGLLDRGLRVIAVDDGSTDATQQRLKKVAARAGDRLVIRTHSRNRGKGHALQTGFEAAHELGATHAVSIDADGQLDPADVPRLIALAEQRPRTLILGRRPDKIENCPDRCRTGRHSASLGLWAQTGLRLSDSQCGLRVYPLEVLRAVRCRSARFAFEGEVIARAVWAGFEVIEVPVACRYFPPAQRVSHYRPWQDSLRQGWLHSKLLLRALVPVGLSGPSRVATGAGRQGGGMLVRLLSWLNPPLGLGNAVDRDHARHVIAGAIGVGVIVGCLPLAGFHALVSLFLSWRWRIPPLLTLVVSQWSLVLWLLVRSAVPAGEARAVLDAGLLPMGWWSGEFLSVWPVIAMWAVVGLPLSVLAGIFAFGVTLSVVRAEPGSGEANRE